MSLGLAFLSVAKTSINGADLEGLCRMKVPGTVSGEDDPFVAFASLELGRQFIEYFPRKSDFSLLPFDGLSPEQIERTNNARAIFFERPDQIAEYNSNREHFNFSSHLVSIAEAMRKVKNAL